jgi:mannose-6-phosphate isomerase-like protein (cupin superfamily)
MFKANIEARTLSNQDYRRVLFTGRHLQLVLMSIPPGGEVDLERHPDTDQFIRVERGRGRVYTGRRQTSRTAVRDGDVVVVAAGTWHRVTNTSSREPLKLYTIYSPPEHPPATRQRTKPKRRETELRPRPARN